VGKTREGKRKERSGFGKNKGVLDEVVTQGLETFPLSRFTIKSADRSGPDARGKKKRASGSPS